ncbi:MAG: indole-3-glycerol phosphate synthase TrpC, partial [Chloroflexota bacterium]
SKPATHVEEGGDMILDELVAVKREELTRSKQHTPLPQLQALASARRPPLDFASAIQGDGVKVIAEIKRASPSSGSISSSLDPAVLALAYVEGGAAAVSVLTEGRYFKGNLEDLAAAGRALEGSGVPLFRKDFIFDAYQVYESRAFGADALLLIVALLNDRRLEELLAHSRSLGMQCLVEVHSEDELKRALSTDAPIIGINNRDLRTMEVDTSTTARLRRLVPPDRIVVSESGIRSSADVAMLRACGVNAVLIGEALVSTPDVARTMRELL